MSSVVSLCFHLHFSNTHYVEHLTCSFPIHMSDDKKPSYLPDLFESLSTFKNWAVFLLSFENSLNILDSSPLSGKWLADIFSLSVTYLFILITVSWKAELLIWWNLNLPVFSFIHYTYSVASKNSLLIPRLQRVFLLCFSSRTCVVLICCIFLSHFKLACLSYEVWIKAYFFAHGQRIVPGWFTEKTAFSTDLLLHVCQKSVDHINMGLFLNALFSTDLLNFYANIMLCWLL